MQATLINTADFYGPYQNQEIIGEQIPTFDLTVHVACALLPTDWKSADVVMNDSIPLS